MHIMLMYSTSYMLPQLYIGAKKNRAGSGAPGKYRVYQNPCSGQSEEGNKSVVQTDTISSAAVLLLFLDSPQNTVDEATYTWRQRVRGAGTIA